MTFAPFAQAYSMPLMISTVEALAWEVYPLSLIHICLVIPKRQLDNIIEMIYALDKIAPGTANEDTLLYGVEVKFYNSKVEVDKNLETKVKGMYALGDGSGVTHSLSQASASGVYVGRILAEKYR